MNQRFPQQNLIQLPQHQMDIVIQVKLGSGAQGSVYKGFIKNNNQQVALKVIMDLNPREEKILQQLKSHKPKHIIRIYAAEKIHNQFYIVMELAEMDFFQFMNTNQFKTYDAYEKSELFLQMTQGVQEFHELGYFHRDLKPENFVCCRDKTQKLIIKLIDFGCSKDQSDIGKQTLQVGTPYYMAQDVIYSANYTKDADIWAMGTIWYEMFTLQTFFQGTVLNNIFHQISTINKDQIDQKIDQIDKCQVEFREIMKQMICIDIQKRIKLEDAIEQISQALQKIQIQQLEEEIKNKLKKEFEEKERQIISHNQMKYEELYRQMELNKENQISQIKQSLKNQYEQQVLNKENELRKVIEQQQQVSNQNQQNNEIQRLQFQLQFQSQLNQYKIDMEQQYQEKMKQEMQLLENKSKNSLLKTKQKEVEENKIQINEEYQKYYQQELNKKQLENQIQFQNQYKKEELKSKKQQLRYIIDILQAVIQTHITSINQQKYEINGFQFNNQEKYQILHKIQNFISSKQNELNQISTHINNFDTQDEYQQFSFLVALETKYKNQYQIDIQENQIIQKEILSVMISLSKEQQQKQFLKKHEQEEIIIKQEMNDQILKYQELTNKFNQQQGQILNIQQISENFSSYNHNINNQFKELKYYQDNIGSLINQLKIHYQSQENQPSRDLINYLQIQQLEIIKSLEKLQENIQLMQDSLFEQEQELKLEIQIYLQKMEEKEKEIEVTIQNSKKVSDEQQNNILLLQEKLQNIQQLFHSLNSLNQTQISQSIKQYIQIKQKYLQEEQNIKDLFDKLLELQQRSNQFNLMTKKYIDFSLHIQCISNQFYESIKELKNELSPIQQDCNQLKNIQIKILLEQKQIELSNFIETAKQRFDEIQLKTKQDIQLQLLESLKDESNSIQKELENQKNQYRIQIIELKNQSQQILNQFQSETDQQFQKIKDEIQFLAQDFNQQQIEFINFDIQNYNYEQIIDNIQKKQEEFKKLRAEMENSSEKYKQNQILVQEKLEKLNSNLSKQVELLKSEMRKIDKNWKEKSQLLTKMIHDIDEQSKKVNFLDLDGENKIQQNWRVKQKSIEELKQKLMEFYYKIKMMQRPNNQEIITLQTEFDDLKNQVHSLIKQIPTNDQIKSFKKIFNDNNQSFLILNSLIIMIKAFNLKTLIMRLQEFQQKQLQKDNQLITESKNKVELEKDSLDVIKKQQKDFNKQNLKLNTTKMRQTLTDKIQSNEIIQKYESFLKFKQIVIQQEELTEDEQKLEKQTSEILNYIKIVNKVKLNGGLRDQDLIKKISDNFFEHLEYSQFQVFDEVRDSEKKF